MAATSAPAVKAVLLAKFQASTLFTSAGVYIDYGPLDVTNVQQECIYFMGTRERERAAALGHQRRDEQYEIEVVVDVVLDGNDPAATEATCFAYVQEIENIVRADAGMVEVAGFSGWCVFHEYEVTPYLLKGSRLSEAVIQIQVVNRK